MEPTSRPAEVALQSETKSPTHGFKQISEWKADGKLPRKINSTQQGQKNFRKENGLGGVANSLIVYADVFHGDPPTTEAALELVTDLEQLTTEDIEVDLPFVYM